MRHNAAYIEGECILNTTQIGELAKIDEVKAKIEAKEKQIKYDESEEVKLSSLKKKEKQISQINREIIDAREKRTLRRQIVEKQQ